MSEPTPDVMYVATADAIASATQVVDARSLGTADVVRQQMIGVLRQFVSRCRDAGVSDQDTAEARYALVAFIDDRLLRSNWAGRSEWQSQPLQLQFFREFTAGENFFARMAAMIQRGGPLLPLEAYYLCLALGFSGAVPAGQTTRGFLEAARKVLLRGRNPDRVAPNAVPTDRSALRPRRFPFAALVVVACAFLCVAGLAAVSASLGRAIDSARAEVVPSVPTATAPSSSR
jgi:type VI secretion system protein ImpK